MATECVLWRRLDVPGHDACRLERSAAGCQIQGTAVFIEEGKPTQLNYQVECDSDWVTLRGHVSGWIGAQCVEFAIVRTTGGVWTMNGVTAPGLENCYNLDFGFTPSTNLLQLKRMALRKEQSATVPVAWLDATGSTLDVLTQHYERRTDTAYWYEAPRFHYAAMLEVAPGGFIRLYPELWEMGPIR